VEKRLIGIEELGHYLNIRPQTIRNRLSSGTFPIRAFKICGRIRFDTKDVERYLVRLRSGSRNGVDSQQGVCDTSS
jgi:predicted DNA-binding transcriptional regulator AlpA